MPELSHALAERLLYLDYDREMALTAFFDGCSGSHAIPPISGPVRAGFAIAVRSDWKGAAWAIC